MNLMILKQDFSANHQDIKSWTRCFFFNFWENIRESFNKLNPTVIYQKMRAIQIKFFFITRNNSVFKYFLFKHVLLFFSYKFKIKFFFIARNINISTYFLFKKHIVVSFYKFKIIYLKFLQTSQFVIYFIKYNILPMTCGVFYQCCGNLLIFLEQKVLSFHTKNSSIGHFRNLYIFSIKKILKSKKDNNQMELD